MSRTILDGLTACATLHNGVAMPWLGLGTWRASDDEAAEAVTTALDLGYRHIDTAAIYGNETGVGEAIASHSVEREQVFITTKVWNDDIKAGGDAARAGLEASLKRLGIDTVDLVLLHWPVPGRLEAWRAMEQAYEQGLARAIGVSNFMVHHLEELLAVARIKPMVNQVEFHPHLLQPELLRFCQAQQIQHEAWSPLMKGQVTEVDELCRIAAAHNKTPAQVAIRWAIQHGSVAIPKSVHRHRIAENADIFDFELAEAEMQAMDVLDRNKRIGADPDEFCMRWGD